MCPFCPSYSNKKFPNILHDVVAAMLRNEIGWFDEVNNSSSTLASRLESDATLLRTVVVDRSTILLQNVGLVATSFIIAFILNWRLTLVVMAMYPLIVSGHISEVQSFPLISICHISSISLF